MQQTYIDALSAMDRVQVVSSDWDSVKSPDINKIVNDYQGTLSGSDPAISQTIQSTVGNTMSNMFDLSKIHLTQQQKLMICSAIVIVVSINLVRAGSVGIRLFGFLSSVLAVLFLLYQIMIL